MRKILTTLSIATALLASYVQADQATVNTLQTYGVPLSAEQNSAIANANGPQLVDALAQLVAAQPVMAATIVAASIRSNPHLTDAIVPAAIAAAPEQEQAINDAVAASKKRLVSSGQSIPSSSIPSEKISTPGMPRDATGSGGGSTRLASPN